MADDCEGTVREVAKVYELIKTHQPLLLLQPAMTTQMAQHLLSEALRALNIALSAMTMMQKQQEIPTASPLPVKPEPHQLSSSPTTSTSARSSKRKRSTVTDGKSSSWTISTTVPYEVGYEWRKYGEKRINGTRFTRSYFRCTHKDDAGCLATKYVQQKVNTDPPVFQVTYNNEHTCNCTATSSSTPNKNRLPITGGAIASNPPTDHGVILKQEETVVPPPLTVNVPLDDHQMPCQEPLLPITDHNVATGDQLAGDSSCIPGMSCNNELDMGWTMMESLMGDDDTELQVLYNSFKYY